MPGPGSVASLAEQELQALLRRVQTSAARARKDAAEARWNVWTEDFKDLIDRRIDETHHDHDSRSRIKLFSSTAVNLTQKIGRRAAVCWKLGARRYIDKADADEVAAFDKAYEEARASAVFKDLNRWAWLIGPTIVVPRVRRREFGFDLLLPHQYDAIFDEENPLGAPVAVVYTVANGDNSPDSVPWTTILDSEGWRFFNHMGQQARPPVPHNLGFFPGVVCRFDEAQDPDWYSATRNQRVFDGTIECAYLHAKLGWVRKSQDKKLAHLFGDLDDLPKGQKMDPEYMLVAQGASGKLVDFGVDDFDTPPAHYIQHIRFVAENVTESLGIPGSTTSFDTSEQASSGSLVLEIEHDALSTVRNDQIPYARSFEHELAWKSTAVMRHMGYKGRGDLPSVEEVKQGFRTEWPELNRVDDPLRLAQLSDWEIKTSQITYVDLVRKRHPTMTRKQAKKLLMDNISEQAEINDFLATRNAPKGTILSDDGVKSAAQVNGAIGGATTNEGSNDDGASTGGGGP
jgi:hypothetical protein